MLTAFFTAATQFKRRFARLEATLDAPGADEILDSRIGKFRHLSALIADGKSNQAMLMTLRVRAGDEGIQAFETVYHSVIKQLFQSTINLQRSAKTVIAKLIEDRIGTEGPIRLGQHIKNERLIAGQIMRWVTVGVLMVVVIAHCPAFRFGEASLLCNGRRLKMKIASAATTIDGPDGVSNSTEP